MWYLRQSLQYQAEEVAAHAEPPLSLEMDLPLVTLLFTVNFFFHLSFLFLFCHRCPPKVGLERCFGTDYSLTNHVRRQHKKAPGIRLQTGLSTTDLTRDSTDKVLTDCTDILTNEGRTGDFVPLKTPGERAELLQSFRRNKKKKMKKKGKRKFYI